jgi:tRNA (cytidine/uridine-2'-O-)-methyltransferase
LNIIEPCGFPWKMREFRKVGMDYVDLVTVNRYSSWQDFQNRYEGRVILMTTKGSISYTDFKFQEGDTLLAGRESVGVPDDVHGAVDARVLIPMHGKARSMNIINACSMITGEALRQVHL